MNLKQVGRFGEELAVDFLKKQGYVILRTNFRCRFGEIDIIAQEGNTIVFVEVKTRKSLKFGLPSESVNFKKQFHIKRVAEYFITYHLSQDKYLYRFDVVEIFLDGKNDVTKINLIKDAF
ncbi:YraN family protein [Anaerocellum diazotrophicum]|uniref:UPF0102 protein CaldiYA01_15250 n=1 Tax=Caldicellulosiruptor diazotrophicus TaxID=2806205 RepID=A0ABM7NN60_9FIRM|nr:YraN family protein [Caldicellulosiruptor diazotrophicus]BCS81565.1 UPF0102 protein [Caldicellulosiruptor diazotrophicus]